MGREAEKAEIKRQIFAAIQGERKGAEAFLEALVRLPSENRKTTYAQELVSLKLRELGFETDVFPCETNTLTALADYCAFPGNDVFSEDIVNVAGVRRGAAERPGNALMLHAHIDTAEAGPAMPDTSVRRENGRMYGLGIADDKCGVAILLLGAQAVLAHCPKLSGRLTLLSTIGKRGAVGTLTACLRSYGGDGAVYLHPAETGHGLREIKNYSMGVAELILTVHGREGVFHDEIDDSEINAIVKGCEVIAAVRRWDAERRRTHRFSEGSFAGLPNTKADFIRAVSGEQRREDVLRLDLTLQVCFGLGETAVSIKQDLENYLKHCFSGDEWLQGHPVEVCFGARRATPVAVDRKEPIVRAVEQNIAEATGCRDFIYQYHGASDIRMPILYGNTPTVGIGTLCGGLSAGEEEWIDCEDYLRGIQVAAGLIVDWCL